MQIKLSKQDWLEIGVKTGWMKVAAKFGVGMPDGTVVGKGDKLISKYPVYGKDKKTPYFNAGDTVIIRETNGSIIMVQSLNGGPVVATLVSGFNPASSTANSTTDKFPL